MRKLILALAISLVLSLAFGGMMVLAASQAEPGNPLYPINQGLDVAVSFLQNTLHTGDVYATGISALDDKPQALDNGGELTSLDDPLDDGDTPEEPKGPKDGAFCGEGGDKLHPIIEKMAQRHSAAGATYDGIKKLFCEDGLGFGEIDLGYRIAAANSIDDVSIIFGMRADGKGWGQIMKVYPLSKPPKDPKPGIGNSNAGGNGNGNAYGPDNNPGKGNPGGNGNAYGRSKNADKGNQGGKGKP